MITIIYQFKHNVTWHCRINQFFSFPEQLQIWIYVFLVGDHRYVIYIHYPRWLCLMYITLMHPNITLHFMLMYLYIILYIIFVQTYCIYTCSTTLHLNHTVSQLPFPLPPLSLNKCVNRARGARSGFSDLLTGIS